MDELIRIKLTTALQSEELQNIANSTGFYFQKAQDALINFKDLNVDVEIKQFLIENKQDYNQLKEKFEHNSEYKEFGNLIFTVISYCDTNAKDKDFYNEYSDKRTLARAYVRMGFWVKHLITYKFENILEDGSIKMR